MRRRLGGESELELPFAKCDELTKRDANLVLQEERARFVERHARERAHDRRGRGRESKEDDPVLERNGAARERALDR